MIRVLQVFSTLNAGGAESRIMDVFRAIDRTRLEFVFLAMDKDEQFYQNEIFKRGGILVKIDAPRKCGAFINFVQLYKAMKNEKYDAVHAHTSFHSGVVLLAAWMARVPVRIAHARTTGTDHQSFKNKIATKFGKILISIFSTERLAISREAGEYLFDKKSFIVLPNAIDYEKYLLTSKESADELRKEYGLDSDAVCLGLVGRFNEMKNHSFAVDVFSKYHEKHENSYLFFVGDGPERNAIEQRVKELGLEIHIIFTGIQSNVNEWMKLFDVLLVPSIFEGLGGVILEAQAAGTPVVKSNTFTDESDMNVGLVKKLPIDEGVDAWEKTIDEMRTIEIPSNETIKKAFDERGYSLTSEIEKLEKIYIG